MIFLLWLNLAASARTTELSVLTQGRHGPAGGVRLIQAGEVYLVASVDRTRQRVVPPSLFKQLRGELLSWEKRMARTERGVRPELCREAVVLERSGKRAVACAETWPVREEKEFRAWVTAAERWTWKI